MKNQKKFISMLLAVLMILTAVPMQGLVGIDLFTAKADNVKITSYSVGDILEFGWYPQSKVDDTALIAELNVLGGDNSTWTSYGYYSGTGSSSDGQMTAGDWMRYTDVIYGSNKYRGVIFDSYRPYYTGDTSSTTGENEYGDSISEQKDNGYNVGTVYWFLYEPIKWRVLDPKTGMVMSETILDSQAYNNYILYSYGYYGDANKTYYSNNYAESSIRQWLNNDFYNTAFSSAQQDIIEYTPLDNSAYSISYSEYNSNATDDKIYLLSYSDSLNANYGFSTSSSDHDTARRAQGSDYAKSQGLWVYTDEDSSCYGNSFWRLRSAGRYSYDTCGVNYDGYVYYIYDTDSTYDGVRPALNFNLSSDIFQSDVKDTGKSTANGTGSKVTDGDVTDGDAPGVHTHTGGTATCSTKAVCSECGQSYGEYDTTNHENVVTDKAVAVTCTETGLTEGSHCEACDIVIVAQTEIPVLGHDPVTYIQPATCTVNGYASTTCTRCYDELDYETLPILEHDWGEWTVDYEPTCAKEGKKHKTCLFCGNPMYEAIETAAHTYDLEVVPPTYLEQGYTLYTCSVCGDTYKDTYVDPLDRIDLSNATLELEYTSVYYEGLALTPEVTLAYEGESFDSSKELKITYINNNQVGTATVTVEGINRFKGTVELNFEISYEVIPKQIVNVIAIGEIGKVSLSWGESSEVSTDSYYIYRKADGETEYQLIKTINSRTVLSYEDTNVEKSKTYSYFVTGSGLYGAESEPSLVVNATVLVDKIAPTVLKVSPSSTSVISGKITLSATATDNIGVTKVAYFYTLDNGKNWVLIGETTNKSFSIVFDTSDLNSESVKVKAVAYDAEGNKSEPVTVIYSLDNVGPEKVTGLSAVTLSSKITLSWNDVTANDAEYFILQTKSGEKWTTVANKITTLGYNITGLQPDTDYIYRVACVDTHGNIGEYSDEFTARTAVDETAPVITSQSPNSARYNSTIKFSATAKDDCDVETIEIQVSTDFSSWTTISTNTYTARTYKQTYTYTIDLSEYAEGSIFVRAIATDFSGNISDTSDAAPYTEYIVDKTAPEAPTDVFANSNDGYITVSWTMGSETDLGKYFVYKSTSLDGNYQLVASNLSTLNYHDRNIQSGREFYYKVKVSDTCGNMSEYSNAASATMSPDTQSPEITSISSTYQQKISSTTHTINVAATDNNKLSCIVVEYCTVINSEYRQLVVTENIDNNYKSISVTLPIDGLVNGEVIYLRAYAVDMAGLKSEYATAKYTFDATAPTVDDFNASLDESTVNLSWKDNGESDLSGFKLYRSVDGENFTLLGSRGVSGTGSYSFIDTIFDKESNTYTYKLESVDKLGNTASYLKSVDYTYVYVNQKPVAQMSAFDYMMVDVEEVFDASGSTDDIAIVSYLWDFGDGTTSTEMKSVKSYDAVGTYTVKLSVTDNEGITSTITKDIEVKERDLLGNLNVKVVDENGKALSYVPIYFDLGSDNQKIIYTNASGVATSQMLSGTHTIGMYASGYLPVKKDVVVLANATRTVTLTTVEEDIVTGNFEITRMTFDEIVAAGIDVYDPANQNVYSATVRVTYGSTEPLNINYVRNDDEIISYTLTDSNGSPITYYTNSNGENRKITGITYIPSNQDDNDVVAIMDIPAEASYLKEFFDVRLHIINNASSEFALEMNEVVLNVPEGMTLMSSVSGDYSSSNIVKINTIKGQETVTLAWVLRGDKAGEYDLSADFTGTLAEFNELVTARFETEEAIKVYGLEGVRFRILTADEIHNDTLYFNIELENERDIDIYMPSIGLTDKIANVTESVLNNKSEEDFFTEAYILNAYIQTENGQKQYVPVAYDSNGSATTAIETLAPGQKIVYEYVAYNAINYAGIAYFKNAAITEFEGVIDNIETGSFHKELYSFTDYSEKLDVILSGTDADVNAAFDYINTDSNYYYWFEAEEKENAILSFLYKTCNVVLNGDFTHLTNSDKKELIKKIILSVLSESSIIDQVDDLLMEKYNKAVKEMIELVKVGTYEKYVSEGISEGDVAKIFKSITKNSKSLAVTYRTKGSDAFKTELTKMIAGSGLGMTIDAAIMIDFEDEAEIFAKCLGKATETASALFKAISKSEREAYYYSVLKLQCNAEISNYILDAIITATKDDFDYSDMINDVAVDMQNQLNSNMNEYYANINYWLHIAGEAGNAAGKSLIKLVMKKMIGSTPLTLLAAGFGILESIFGFGDYYKQQDSMCIYNALSISFVNSFNYSIETRSSDNDYYSMLLLRAICELRLDGEKQYKSFIQDYVDGSIGLPLNETKVMKKINTVFETSFSTVNEWYDDVQYNIVHSRDILFNVEGDSEIETPRAPVVTLDYDKLQTVQTFTPEYEYCFADGVWRKCSNEPIAFEVGVTPSVLRVRKAASDANFAGEITTIKIFARKDLSKLITAKFDGINYLLDNLSAKYNYQVIFTNDMEATVDWSVAQTIVGSDSTVKISGVGEYSNIIIRSCQNSDLYETTSKPLSLTVSKKKLLNLVIDGSGTVAQTADSGSYFNGESIDLIATADVGCSFIGWYIDDICVSTDKHYIVEMADGLEVVAQFTGVKIKSISIEELPAKLNYYEGESLDLNGIKVLVTYSDGTTTYAGQFAAHLSSNMVGKSTVVVIYGGYSTSYDITINHKYTLVVIVPTCAERGYTTYTCYICGNTYFGDYTDANGHIGGTATCKKQAICAVCGESYGELDGNNHENVVTDKAVAATCTNTGLTEGSHCEACNTVIAVQTEISKLSHTEETIHAIAATCTKTGLTEGKKCSVCQEILVKQIETGLAEHKYNSVVTVPTCTSTGYTTYTCSECNGTYISDTAPALGHDMGEFVLAKEPTCTEEGIRISECSRCDYYEDEKIPATGHNFENGTCTECGKKQQGLSCSCNCHKTGFMGFIWKIQRFFYKLFKINPTCSCGAAHY